MPSHDIDDHQTVLVLQHVACETLGTIKLSLQSHGLKPRYIRIHEGESIPADLGNACALIVMGGPMSVYEFDHLPHLRDEMRLIETSLKAQRPLLGVCLGSQLLAHVLGAKVYPGRQKEIGWHPVTLTEQARCDPLWSDCPETFQGFHWHGDIFDLPAGCAGLASSPLTACQAFRADPSAYGILFHLEVTLPLVAGMARSFPDELAQAGGNQDRLLSEAEKHLPQLSAVGRRIFGRWAELAANGIGEIPVNSRDLLKGDVLPRPGH
jgi:GMP synthase (glutamine-hydrolysing)